MSERERIEFLVRRDGVAAARAWVERTLKLYGEAVAGRSHASTHEYRPLFEASIREFEAWLQGKDLSQFHSADEVSVR